MYCGTTRGGLRLGVIETVGIAVTVTVTATATAISVRSSEVGGGRYTVGVLRLGEEDSGYGYWGFG